MSEFVMALTLADLPIGKSCHSVPFSDGWRDIRHACHVLSFEVQQINQNGTNTLQTSKPDMWIYDDILYLDGVLVEKF